MTLTASVNPTGRFSDRVANTIKHRPAYPAAVIDALRAHQEAIRKENGRVGEFQVRQMWP